MTRGRLSRRVRRFPGLKALVGTSADTSAVAGTMAGAVTSTVAGIVARVVAGAMANIFDVWLNEAALEACRRREVIAVANIKDGGHVKAARPVVVFGIHISPIMTVIPILLIPYRPCLNIEILDVSRIFLLIQEVLSEIGLILRIIWRDAVEVDFEIIVFHGLEIAVPDFFLEFRNDGFEEFFNLLFVDTAHVVKGIEEVGFDRGEWVSFSANFDGIFGVDGDDAFIFECTQDHGDDLRELESKEEADFDGVKILINFSRNHERADFESRSLPNVVRELLNDRFNFRGVYNSFAATMFEPRKTGTAQEEEADVWRGVSVNDPSFI